MRCKVQLYVAGKTFYEEMEATDYQHARQIALARNPGATVVSVNAVFGGQSNYESSSVNFSSANDSYSSSSSDTSGIIGLAGLAVAGWLAWEAWKLGSAIIITAWQWIVGAAQWTWGLFSWIPFMSPQLLVGLIFGFFFIVLILGALDE
jgi:hypothetical protein